MPIIQAPSKLSLELACRPPLIKAQRSVPLSAPARRWCKSGANRHQKTSFLTQVSILASPYNINFEMHRQQKLGNFINKLQYLLTRQEYSEIICWDKTETTIEILSEERMETEIIPLYFRHQKFESFVRQLNLYGFKKVKSSDRHRFTHPLLLEGEKLQTITSHKLHSRKEGKQEGKDSPLSEKSQPCGEGEGKKEKNSHSSLNSITQFPKNTNTAASANTTTSANYQTLPQELPQLVSAYPQPYLNYWNMMLIHPGNQYTPLLFINSFPTNQ